MASFRGAMERATVTCAACGARMGARRTRCLRCEAPLALAEPGSSALFVEPAGSSSRAARIAAAVLTTSLIGGLAALFIMRPSTAGDLADSADRSAPTSASPRSDGLAQTSRRQPPASLDREEADLPPSAGVDPATLGSVALRAGDLDAAREQLVRAVAANSDDATSVNALGLVLERVGDIEGAVARFERAVALEPGVWAYRFNLAHALGRFGNWGRAVDEYRVATRLFPTDYATAFNLARALHRQGRPDEAVPEFERAISLAPGEATFHRALGASLQKLGRTADARHAYARYLEMAPEAPDAERIRSYLKATASVSGGPRRREP